MLTLTMDYEAGNSGRRNTRRFSISAVGLDFALRREERTHLGPGRTEQRRAPRHADHVRQRERTAASPAILLRAVCRSYYGSDTVMAEV